MTSMIHPMQRVMREKGKFELQPTWVERFWYLALQGLSDRDLYEGYVFIVSANDRRVYGFDEDTYAVGVSEDNDGFVRGVTFIQSEYEELIDEEG